jgi:hypothetical protein
VRAWTVRTTSINSGTSTYIASHAQVTARVAAAKLLPKWNLLRFLRVATSVSTVKLSTVGTAIRAFAQFRCRPASASIETLAQ